MGYLKHRIAVHFIAFLIGLLSFSWMFLGLVVLGHYFISPAQAAQISGDVDIDRFREDEDFEGAMAFSRTVNILTIQSTVFSGLWYLAGLGISMLI